MACVDCSNGRGNTNALPGGCKNNGACGTSGCNKLNVFDWLANMKPSVENPFDWVEVRFKSTRKEYFRNTEGLRLLSGDAVAVEANPGHDIGVVSLTGELVRLQMRKAGVPITPQNEKKVFRKARPNDVDRWKMAMEMEKQAMMTSRSHAVDLKLDMKISDVEYQGDGTKATFFYIAENRVDFRELIKLLARDLKVKIDMRQIGARQEAGRVGGIGSCGRELCCSTWLRDFRTVSTTAARYQQLSINPEKLAGQCGKLKCCLNYELESYMEALKEFPASRTVLKTSVGEAVHVKTDIFKRLMFYAYREDFSTFYKLNITRVKEIMEMNSKGVIPEKLTPEENTEDTKAKPVIDFKNVQGEDSISRFDKKKNPPQQQSKNKNRNNHRRNKPQGGNENKK